MDADYTTSASSNSFRVSADGVYQVIMNMQLSSRNGSSPVIGIWNNTRNEWVARVNDRFSAGSDNLQTYSLITSIPMVASNTYSFRLAPSGNSTTIRHISSGSTGSGPVTQVALKRLR